MCEKQIVLGPSSTPTNKKKNARWSFSPAAWLTVLFAE